MTTTSAPPSVSCATRWKSIIDEVAGAFRMEGSEADRFRNHWAVNLIAALPFLAGARHPERTAATHLGTYLLSIRETKRRFYADEDDDKDVMARLEPIAHFVGGDQAIIDRGLARLALNMVVDYHRDQTVDSMLGKHNPVALGVWDAEEIVAELRQKISRTPCPAMDEIVAADPPDDAEEFWAP